MRFIFSFLFSLTALFSCTSGPGDSPATGLRVSDPDRLYFKNVRTNLYTAIDDNELHLTKYVHRKFADDDAPVRLVLVDNWIHGLAYLEMETSAGVASGTILHIGPPATSWIIYTSEGLNNRQALSQLKADLTGSERICYPGTGEADEYCFPAGSPAREALRETIFDFLRLTELEG